MLRGYGDEYEAYFGTSVASAGDVNGDGYSDVVIGAPSHSGAGRARLYLGSAAGLSTTAAWMAESDSVGTDYGRSVASAGDVNGDGFDDVVVGAPYDHILGRAYLYLGGLSGPGTNAAWTVSGDQDLAWFGWSVASAGDIDGDGYGEVVIGAPRYTHDQGYEGRVSVYFGSASGPDTAAAWTQEPDLEDMYFGTSVASAGDVNADGYVDVLVGAPGYSGRDNEEGRVFVYLGRAERLAERATWTVSSDEKTALMGTAVASAGDVNGDGQGDVVVGAPGWIWHPHPAEGRAYLYVGCLDSPDADGDGQRACEDCDDASPDVNPSATEVCDRVDNDCDGTIDIDAVDAPTWYADADADGYTDPPDDGVDQDCDGVDATTPDTGSSTTDTWKPGKGHAGCGCASFNGAAPVWAAVGLLGALVLRRRAPASPSSGSSSAG